ncbi:glycosyl hydrolase family 71-domain-containing protein, partial [Lasiosphaeria miniovina]
DMQLAQDAHIDAFAMNVATGDASIYNSLALAFDAARLQNFKLFLSFDYLGGSAGPWGKGQVLDLASTYFARGEYLRYNGKPLASTFEGSDQAGDWVDVKRQTGCFFLPDWSSRGARGALDLQGGVADGLFAWTAWPWGNRDMDSNTDASYDEALRDQNKPYMMAVSPWFYTNLPGWSKNWLWRGDDLWADRWNQIIEHQPEFVEIVTWNDYGESSHISPLYDNAMGLFNYGKAPFNYAQDMPHDGWRQFLPFLIDTYKGARPAITKEGLTSWYRTSPAAACSDGGTPGNTASQMQLEFSAAQVSQDRVFYSALLASDAQVEVTVGGRTQAGSWKHRPDGGVGVYHGSVEFGGRTGDVVIRVSRGGSTIAQINGRSVSPDNCRNGLNNWNAWVGSAMSGASIPAASAPGAPAKHPFRWSDGDMPQYCVEGHSSGDGRLDGLCRWSCALGFCPIHACTCTRQGTSQPGAPGWVNVPATGVDGVSDFGLCDFACHHSNCPGDVCRRF